MGLFRRLRIEDPDQESAYRHGVLLLRAGEDTIRLLAVQLPDAVHPAAEGPAHLAVAGEETDDNKCGNWLDPVGPPAGHPDHVLHAEEGA